MRTLLARTYALFRRRRLDRDLDDDVRAHLDLLAADYERQGMTPADARFAAHRAFGGVEQMKERHRERRGIPWLESVYRDIAYALRTLTRQPVFAVAAVLTLALGIGANTALFSVIDALMLKRLPVARPDELRLFTIVGRGDTPGFSFSHPVYEDIRTRADAFSGVVAFGSINQMRVVVGGRPSPREPAGAPQADPTLERGGPSDGLAFAEVARSQGVSGNFFSVLGVRPAAGRLLDPADDRADAPAGAAVLSDGFWARRFGRDPTIVGRRITLNEVPFTVVGVAPTGFHGVQIGAEPDIWWPIHELPRLLGVPPAALSQRDSQSWRILARLRPGTDAAGAEAQAQSLFQADLVERFERRAARPGASRTPAERQAFMRQALRLESGAAGWTELRWQFKRPLFVLMIVVALVLLIACANVANLLLARASARRREIGVRLALGSSRGRLMQQLMTESLVLTAVGGFLGVGVAFLGSRLVAAFMEDQDVALSVGPDVRVLAFTAVVSLASALLFGLMPSLSAARGGYSLTLAAQARPAAGGGRLTVHNAVLIAQVALSVVVLIAAGLFLRTLTNLQRLDTGFNRENLTVLSLDIPAAYEPARRVALYRGLIERVATEPGATATFSIFGLLSGNGFSAKIAVSDDTSRSDEDLTAWGSIVGPGFFEVTGTRLIAGRGFTREDDGSPLRVAVVNQTIARRFFGPNPIGRRFALPGAFPGDAFEIVGVVADSPYRSIRREAGDGLPTFYLPASQPPGASIALRMRDVQVEVRTAAGTADVEATVRRVIREIDPGVVVTDVRSMNAIVDRTIAQERMLARLAASFAALALALSAVGIYGVRSYSVSRRTRDLGVRMALGADAGQVFRLVVREGVMMALAGVALGLVAAAALTRYVEGLLFGVTPLDRPTFAAVSVVLVAVAILASYMPARRAARVNPAVTLRGE